MRGRLAPLLLFAAATAGFAAHAATPVEARTQPAWLTIQTVASATDIEPTYQAMLRDQFARAAGTDTDLLAQRLGTTTEFTFRDASYRFDEGQWKGDWTFYRRGSERWPIAYLRVQFPDQDRYAVRATVHCRTESAQCEQALAQALRLGSRAPEPPYSSPAAVYDGWRDIVIAEDCELGESKTPAPSYPPEEQRRGITGSTTLLVLINRCGESRGVQVEHSSGNRNLDRSAMQSSRRWHLAPSPTGKGGYVRVPVNFELTPPLISPPAPSPTSGR